MVRNSCASLIAGVLALLAAFFTFGYQAHGASPLSGDLIALTAAEQVEAADTSAAQFPARSAPVFSGRFALLETRDALERDGMENRGRDPGPETAIQFLQPIQIFAVERFSGKLVRPGWTEPVPPISGAFFKIRARPPPRI